LDLGRLVFDSSDETEEETPLNSETTTTFAKYNQSFFFSLCLEGFKSLFELNEEKVTLFV
jgi:hypothetical protein